MPAEATAHLLLGALDAGRIASDVGRSLRESCSMLWATLWALVLGFGLSGAVQAFVSRRQIERQLGDHGPRAVARASLYGAASSSCSYAASAMARSLFAGGADFVTSMAFMLASTNLVFELGIVLVVLIGWQFLLAEIIGGVLMIAGVVAIGSVLFRGRPLDQARRLATRPKSDEAEGTHLHLPWQARARTRAGWSDAAAYTISDLTMLRKEIVIGFAAAGFLAVLVPSHAWNDLFLHGHGLGTTLENVAVGPLVAIVSFVCSVGNVPLAAALWKGGISFGGVVSFVFADLITLPLLLIYRKQYGSRMAGRMLGVFWLAMSAAGLAVQELFSAFGWVPTRPTTIAAGHTVGPNATTGLDVVALALLATLYWLYRTRATHGGGTGYAQDPVCGMQVEIAHAPASGRHRGAAVYFCSEHCAARFAKEPERYDQAGASR